MIIVKKGFLKISVQEKRPLESSNKSMHKHSFKGGYKFTKHAFFYYLASVFFCAFLTTVLRLKNQGLSLNRVSLKLWKFIIDFDAKGENNEINELSIIESQCDIFPFVFLNL